MKIYFQALKIIIFGVLACFFLSIPMFCYWEQQVFLKALMLKLLKGSSECAIFFVVLRI